MIRSMTGFGSAALETEALRGSVSARSVNHRFLDVSVHLSRRLQPLEAEVKKRVQARVQRGRVEVSVQAAEGGGPPGLNPARAVIAGLVAAARALQAEHGLGGQLTVSDVVRFPGAFEAVEGVPELPAEVGTAVLGLVDQALHGLDGMRRAEGAHLAQDLAASLKAMEEVAERVAAGLEEGRATRQEALKARVRAVIEDLGLDEGRVYQEIVRVVDRSDVAEELQRLKSHVAQARALLAAEGACGKRLDFLAQELGRESNTMGAKLPTSELVQQAIALKTEVERFREQVQNVE